MRMQPCRLQAVQRLVDALARQPDQVAELLLRDAQQAADAGVEHRVEQRRQAARHAHVGVAHAVDLARADELAQALVELLHHEAVERDAALEQPVEGLDAEPGDDALAQRLDVVAVDLALDHRALAEPAAGRHAGEGDRHAHRGVVAHLEQAVDHAEPEGRRPADAAQQLAGADLHHPQVADDALALVGLQRGQPGDVAQLGGVGAARPLEQAARRATATGASDIAGKSPTGLTLGLSAQRQHGVKHRPSIASRSRRSPSARRQRCRLDAAASTETPGADDVPPPDAGARRRAPAGAGPAREGIRHLADARPGASWRSWCASWPAAWPRPACSAAQHIVVVGDEPAAAVRLRCWPRSRSARCRFRCTRTRSRAEFVFPINNAEVAFAVVEDQEQVDKMLEICASSARSLARIWYDDPRGLRNYDEPGLASLDALIEAGREHARQHPGFFDAEVAKADAARRGRDVLHLGHHRQPQGRGAHALHAARPRQRRRATSTS